MHNTFTTTQIGNEWSAVSHNFPDISAKGKTEGDAIDSLVRAVQYFKDNDTENWRRQVKARIEKKLECLCGVPLKDDNFRIIN